MVDFKERGAWKVIYRNRRRSWTLLKSSQVTPGLVHLFLSCLPPRPLPSPDLYVDRPLDLRFYLEASVLRDFIDYLHDCYHLLTSLEWHNCELGPSCLRLSSTRSIIWLGYCSCGELASLIIVGVSFFLSSGGGRTNSTNSCEVVECLLACKGTELCQLHSEALKISRGICFVKFRRTF